MYLQFVFIVTLFVLGLPTDGTSKTGFEQTQPMTSLSTQNSQASYPAVSPWTNHAAPSAGNDGNSNFDYWYLFEKWFNNSQYYDAFEKYLRIHRGISQQQAFMQQHKGMQLASDKPQNTQFIATQQAIQSQPRPAPSMWNLMPQAVTVVHPSHFLKPSNMTPVISMQKSPPLELKSMPTQVSLQSKTALSQLWDLPRKKPLTLVQYVYQQMMKLPIQQRQQSFGQALNQLSKQFGDPYSAAQKIKVISPTDNFEPIYQQDMPIKYRRNKEESKGNQEPSNFEHYISPSNPDGLRTINRLEGLPYGSTGAYNAFARSINVPNFPFYMREKNFYDKLAANRNDRYGSYYKEPRRNNIGSRISKVVSDLKKTLYPLSKNYSSLNVESNTVKLYPKVINLKRKGMLPVPLMRHSPLVHPKATQLTFHRTLYVSPAAGRALLTAKSDKQPFRNLTRVTLPISAKKSTQEKVIDSYENLKKRYENKVFEKKYDFYKNKEQSTHKKYYGGSTLRSQNYDKIRTKANTKQHTIQNMQSLPISSTKNIWNEIYGYYVNHLMSINNLPEQKVKKVMQNGQKRYKTLFQANISPRSNIAHVGIELRNHANNHRNHPLCLKCKNGVQPKQHAIKQYSMNKTNSQIVTYLPNIKCLQSTRLSKSTDENTFSKHRSSLHQRHTKNPKEHEKSLSNASKMSLVKDFIMREVKKSKKSTSTKIGKSTQNKISFDAVPWDRRAKVTFSLAGKRSNISGIKRIIGLYGTLRKKRRASS